MITSRARNKTISNSLVLALYCVIMLEFLGFNRLWPTSQLLQIQGWILVDRLGGHEVVLCCGFVIQVLHIILFTFNYIALDYIVRN